MPTSRAASAAVVVIGGDVTDDDRFVGQSAIEDDRGNPFALGVGHRRHERRGVERRQDDAVDALRHEIADDVDLPLAIVLEQGALPVNIDVAEFLGRLEGAGVHRLPEHVRRALGNHGDAITPLAVRGRTGLRFAPRQPATVKANIARTRTRRMGSLARSTGPRNDSQPPLGV